MCYLEMSPQYHSASCRAMLLLKLLEGTGVDDFTGLGGKAATKTRREKKGLGLVVNKPPLLLSIVTNQTLKTVNISLHVLKVRSNMNNSHSEKVESIF